MGWPMLLRIPAVAAVAAYAGVAGYMGAYQRSFIYQPDTERVSPETFRPSGFTEEVVVTPDGAKLVSWWMPPKPGRPVMVYFHGNGGNISYRASRAALFKAEGCGALLVGYRGYGGSTGEPSEAALMADARMMLDRLAARGIPSSRLVLFGESLGTGIAVALASERPVAAVILDSPYTTLADVAALRMPYLPVHLLMLDRYDSLATIGRVHAPLLVIHGDQDDVVPFEMGERLFAAANEPKSLVRIPGGGHVSDLNEQSMPAIRKLLQSLR